MFRRPALLATAAACALLAGGVACFTNVGKEQRGAQPPVDEPVQADTPEKAAGAATTKKSITDAALEKLDGLLFVLREGREPDEGGARANVAKGEPLSDDAVDKLLARLPKVAAEKGDEKEFALRESSLPAPKTGKTVKDQFPPEDLGRRPPEAAAKKLEVLRFQPDGEVPIARELSVTFSLPMVPVTSHAELAATERPVKLTPEPKGKWRWIGTKTILFEADVRFPMATEYRVEIPAGTKAMDGAVIDKAVSFVFSTPAPTVKSFFPQGGPVRRDVLMYAAFDQRIDRAEVLKTISVQAGSKKYALALATDEQLAADETIRVWAAGEQEGRWLAFRAEELFPADTAIKVSIGAGTASAEGPRKTKKAQEYGFQTYSPLKITEHRCGWSDNCPPFQPFNIWFNNPLDMEVFQDSWIEIDPPIAGVQIVPSGTVLSISGKTKGRTKYKVTINSALKDAFGQTLGKEQELSFSVGSAEPMLMPIGDVLTVIDPSGKPEISFQSVNYPRMIVRIWKTKAEDYPAFLRAISYDAKQSPPGDKIRDGELKIDGEKDELAITHVDLAPHLGKSGTGHFILEIRPPANLLQGYAKQNPPRLWKWVQVTRLGVAAFVDADVLVPWITKLADGTPATGATIRVEPHKLTAVAGAEGMAELALPEAAGNGPALLIASQGEDTAFVAEQNWAYQGKSGWAKSKPRDYLRFFIFDDRGMYRPGEKVRIKGWIRRVSPGKGGDVGALGDGAKIVDWRAADSRGNELAKGKAELNALGGFYLELDLPKTVNLGSTSLVFSANGGSLQGFGHQAAHYFQVQEFRRPEFEVSASASEGPHLIGSKAIATVKASYYAGGGLPNADTTWSVSASAGSFSPPNRDDYTFGTWVPWWLSYGGGEESYGRGRGRTIRPGGSSQYQAFQGKTDSSGEHHLEIDLQAMNPPRPMNITAQASVMDVNRQAWSAQTSLLVHPAAVYVGLKTLRPFVQEGESLKIDAIAVDLDGKAVPERPIAVRSVRLEWRSTKGVWSEVEVDEKSCALTSKTDAVRCELAVGEGGSYKVRALVTDSEGRKNQSEIRLWVAGGKTPPDRGLAQEKVELVPDKQNYRPGDTAEILVRSPFAPAEGVLTLRRSGIIKTERFTMKTSTHVLNVKLEDAHVPNLYVQVDLVGAAVRQNDQGEPDPKLPKRPAYATGTINLPIPPLERTLKVSAVPKESALEPGAETSLAVTVQGSDGQPVAGAEVAIVVVDESVLALSGYRIGNPLDAFYQARSPDARDYHSRANVWLATPDLLATADGAEEEARSGGAPTERAFKRSRNGAPPGQPAPEAKVAMRAEASMDKESNEETNAPITLRTNFDALALFAPAAATDASGRVEVKVKVPDNLTRYRVTAVAVHGAKRFGLGESSITARKPLMVRPSAPRFLNFGDQFEFPVVLQNQTDKPLAVEVAMRVTNAELKNYRGLRVTVPAQDRVEVRFPTAAKKAGTARFQVVGAAGRATDAAELSLPVWTPATTEAFATYGELDEGAIKQPIVAPSDAVTQFGGLEITTASTQLQALTDAVVYLTSYPYECSEQISSRVLTVAAMRDVLNAFEAEGLPPPKELLNAVDRDLERLQGMQNADGGMPFWKRGDQTWPFNSIHTAHAFARAKLKKFKVPEATLARLHQYLRNIERNYPAEYGPETRRVLTAYALYVRNLLDDPDPARARSLIAELGGVEKTSLEALGWLYPILSASKSEKELTALRRFLNNRVTETAGTAHFVTSYADGGYLLLASDRRADGLILDGLIQDQPKNDLIPKIVRGLLAHRKRGHWGSTQENIWVLLAFDRYFHTYEGTPPNFVARAWLGDKLAGEHTFRGRTTEQHLVEIPMGYLASKAPKVELTLAKQGSGRMYYRIGMKYAPKSLKLEPAEHGFTVERKYEAVDKADDVRRDPDGTWRVKAGARVRVRLSMVAVARRYHVALVDPMPAGFEPMNAALAVTGDIPAAPADEESVAPGGRGKRGWWWWWGPWYEHENLRDERVEAFTSLLWEGVHSYNYVARATTPGDYVVPPLKAEEMYAPETFGRSASDRVIVE